MAELVTRPLDAVRRMFQQTGGSQAGDWGVRAAFEAALADPAVLAQVQIVLCADAWSGTCFMSKPCAQLPRVLRSCSTGACQRSISTSVMPVTAASHAARTNGNATHFHTLDCSACDWLYRLQVPYLNADTIDGIPQGGLVRYRGMVRLSSPCLPLL
jgi:hypothetical protein